MGFDLLHAKGFVHEFHDDRFLMVNPQAGLRFHNNKSLSLKCDWNWNDGCGVHRMPEDQEIKTTILNPALLAFCRVRFS